MFKNPQFDLKFQYRRNLEIGAVVSLVLIIAFLIVFKRFETEVVVRSVEAPPIQVEDIPITQTVRKVEVPPKPTIPVEDPKIDPLDEIPLPNNMDLIFNIAPPPPPPSIADERVPIYIVEIKPKLIGGIKAIHDYIVKHNLYPKMAYEAGVSGIALIGFSIDKNGKTTNVHVIEERPADLGFGDAGVRVMKEMKFTPGIQRDKPVGVKDVQQSIKFELE
ncbi:TonB family protein [bacterium]|nr:TonB family protein [bacterium]